MSYRDAAHPCPVCRVGMRAFQDRLVCDACGSMQLQVADFQRQISASDEVVVVDDTRTQRQCPRCSGVLRSCEVRLGTLVVDGEILHCAADGLWFEAGLLEQILAQIGLHGHRGSGIGRTSGGASAQGRAAAMVGSGTLQGAALSAVGSAFARASADPYEPLRWWEKNRPRVHTPFASTLSMEHLACPTCSGRLHLHGSLWGCDAGDGVFVEYPALEAMLAEMANAPWETPPPTGASGTKACPACTRPMSEQDIEAVQVDRCVEHGIWFDSGELERALQHTGEPRISWFRRVFWHR